MSSSYRRRCKKCGRWIQLRKMPKGQWVAFEGYDTPHDCNSPPPEKSTKPPISDQPGKDPGYDSLDFIDFTVPGTTEKKTERPVTPQGRVSRPTYTPPREMRGPKSSSQSLSEIRDLVDLGIADYRVLTITFLKRNGEVTVRDIEPLLRSNTHCTAYCRLKSGLRTFRLDGIKKAVIKDEKFTPRSVSPEERSRLDEYGSLASLKKKWRIPAWVWVVLAIILIYLLSKK